MAAVFVLWRKHRRHDRFQRLRVLPPLTDLPELPTPRLTSRVCLAATVGRIGTV